MLLSPQNLEIRNQLSAFDKKIEDMHLAFYKYYNGEDFRMPDLEGLERELFIFSRRKIIDMELSGNLDRILFKFQNRKKIWLGWIEETRHTKKK
jgi:hypothetical protein